MHLEQNGDMISVDMPKQDSELVNDPSHKGESPVHFREKVLILSVLLHILFFLIWENATRLGIFQTVPPAVTQSEPIVVDLQQGTTKNQKRVIETTPDAEIPKPPEKADFFSDRNAKARNPEADTSKVLSDAPFNKGDMDSQSLPPTPRPAPQTSPQVEPQPPQYTNLLNTEKYVRENFQKELRENEQTNSSERERIGISHQELAKRVKDMGGLSFNTYNWDFAPYMLRLKALIEQNIHPPHAFTHLGMISGVTLLRFKIYPNGELRDLEVLDYNGHKTLMETSTSAVQISAPFPDLPKNFPQPFLEVTGKFIYMIRQE